eukprot:469306_1
MLILVVLSLAIVASKAALSCNGVFRGEQFYPAGVCQGTELAEYSHMFQYVCKGGKMYHMIYSTNDCSGVPSQESDACLYQDDCTSICDQDPCEYIKHTGYQGVISCDPIVLNRTTGTVSTGVLAGDAILGQCKAYSDDYSQFYSCDHNDSSVILRQSYSSNDCTGDSTYDYWFVDSCNVDTGIANTYSCDIANEPIITSVLTKTPETITEQESYASSFGIFVVMVFVHVVGMLSWM